MKRILTSLLLITSLAAPAQAVLVGVDAGYLLDSEEEFLAARIGFEVANARGISHQLDFEAGFTDTNEDGVKGDIVPLMLNYRLVKDGGPLWGYYFGAGAGIARTRIDGVSTGGPIRLHDESLALQALAGITYRLGETAELVLGARYIWIDDVTFVGQSFEIGDDVAVSLGLNFKF